MVEETKPSAAPPVVVEETPEAPSGKPEEELLHKPETTPPAIDESTADKEQGKDIENQKADEEAAKQQKADEETGKQGQTAD